MLQPTGRVDPNADTVMIEFNLQAFNEAERRVAAEERMAPASGELKRGSLLTGIKLTAYPRAAGPGTQDVAHGCSYNVEEP